MDEFDPKKATTDLVAAFVSNNSLAAEQLPALLASVFTAVTAFGAPIEEPAAPEQHIPKVSVRSSTRDPNFIISLITGEKLKTLKRHLKRHGLTPAEYRERYNLPRDYPMVSPVYSDHRRAVAQRLGLGRKSVKAAPVAVPEVPAAPPAAESAPAPAAAAKPARASRAAPAKKAPAAVALTTAPAVMVEKPTRSRKLGVAFAKTAAPAVTAPSPAKAETATPPKRKAAKPAPAAETPQATTPALPAKTPGRRTRNPK